MAEEKEIYITSVSYGYVLAWQSAGSPSYAVVQVRDPTSKAQRWVVEPSDEKNVVALRNAANGGYLNTQEAKNFGKVAVGAKQLWRIDSPDFVHAQGGVRLQPQSFDKYFLNHDGPHRTNFGDRGQKAHMWQWQVAIAEVSRQRWEINSVWYLGTTGDFDALGAATGQASASNEESEKKIKDPEAREAAISSRESDVQKKDKQVQDKEADLAKKNKQVEDKEAEMAKKDSKQQEDLSARQKELQDRETKLASEEEKQKKKNEEDTKQLSEREKDLAEREKSAKENNGKAQDYEQKLKDLEAREQGLASKEKDSAESNKSKQEEIQARETKLVDEEKRRVGEAEEKAKDVQKRESDLEERERQSKEADEKLKDLQERESNLEEREKQLKERESAASKTTSSGGDAEKTPDSRANQSKPRSAQKTTTNGATSDPRDDQLKAMHERLDNLEKQVNGKSEASGDSAGKNSCDHKISRPPKKLERKVVGYVYAPKE
ncbi:hypothetical protein LTR78_003778 [Recurvomyces mirabilis]|uniref:Uncharacterized protein n=1 Tax=Recurvomyces mirabilis TaxID=574656 RepID=A0AAE0WRI6_9PEZI|nr:hypothetical protein LTR78_003778 [Recurvomyces mirabilis]KAK5154890.1 hypothetical protein LTS14_006471 [Recurvomyces mirabilis]